MHLKNIFNILKKKQKDYRSRSRISMALASRVDIVNRSRSSGQTEIGRQGSSGGILTCYVTQPDDSVIHIDVDSKAEGQDVLCKVCKILGIMDEREYFGMQYAASKGNLIWLNIRNRLSRQIPGSQPYHLFFKVKYFVPPHTIQLEGTRHQFYLNAKKQLVLGLWDAECSLELLARLIALMAFIQFGSFNPATTPCKYACFWADRREEISHELIHMAANFHRELTDTTTLHAEYELLRIAHSEVPAYGVCFYEIRDTFDRRLFMGVGPEFVSVCASDMTFIDKYPYCRLLKVTVATRVVTLSLLEDDGSTKTHNYQLSGCPAANSLYRAIIEVQCFFRCDNVRDDILNQTSQNFNNPFAAIFEHNVRDYAFDVRLTCREVSDRAKRRLFRSATELASSTSAPLAIPSTGTVGGNGSSSEEGVHLDPLAPYYCGFIDRQNAETASSHPDSVVSSDEVQELVLERLHEAAKCRVCTDKSIDRVFLPCGHAMCCEDCADRVDQCPVCRQQIEIRHPLFLPWDDIASEQILPTDSSHHQHPNLTLKVDDRNNSFISTSTSSVHRSKVKFDLSSNSNTHSMPSLLQSTSEPIQPTLSSPSDSSTAMEMLVTSSVTNMDSNIEVYPLQNVASVVQEKKVPLNSSNTNKQYNQNSNFNFFHRQRHRSKDSPEASTSNGKEATTYY